VARDARFSAKSCDGHFHFSRLVNERDRMVLGGKRQTATESLFGGLAACPGNFACWTDLRPDSRADRQADRQPLTSNYWLY
jgi:hypothetical protein